MTSRRLGAVLGAALALSLAATAASAAPPAESRPTGAVQSPSDARAGHDATSGPRSSGQRSRSLVRRTSLGPIRGVRDREDRALSWLGIPYAQPPVGKRRWRPPAPARPWQATRPTTRTGVACLQGGRFYSPAPDGRSYNLSVREGMGRPVGSEDCLTLNISRPDHARRDLPVVVYLHGGSNMVGWSGDPIYDTGRLADRLDAVTVTVNSRLGLFGWLNLGALKNGRPDNDSGNFGTLDQIEALRFVQANATAFGGDPRNITVMGESAGAVNTWALLVSPQTRGLVHRAVPLSGGISPTTVAGARQYADRFAARATEGRDVAPDELAGFLRRQSGRELMQVTLDDPQLAAKAPAVLPDGHVLPADPGAAIAAGSYRKVPILGGNTTEEGKLFGRSMTPPAYRISEYDRFTMQYRFDPDAPSPFTIDDFLVEDYLPVDRPVTGWDDAAQRTTVAVFQVATTRSMGAVLEQRTRADPDRPARLFHYQFAWDQEPEPFDDLYGAAHATDVPFVFGEFGRSSFSFGYSEQNRRGREALAGRMADALAAFIRTGDPNSPRLGARWPDYPRSLRLDAGDRRARLSPTGPIVAP